MNTYFVATYKVAGPGTSLTASTVLNPVSFNI